jgi:proteasome accessory factor B
LERLLNLTAALLETVRPLTAQEIRDRVPGYPDKLESFRRQFERDKEDLREMGIPLVIAAIPYTDPPAEGYRIPKDQYYLREPGLTPDELAALHVASTAVRLDGIEGAGALWKLGGLAEPVGRGDGGSGEVGSLPSDRRLIVLFDAVTERRPVEFRYRDEERTVDPYRLDFRRGRWYVSGFDHRRGDERVFRVDRIDGTVTAGPRASFARPETAVPGARLEPWQLGEGAPVVARILVDADQAPMATRLLGRDAIVEERADGAVVVSLDVTSADGFRSFILGFLDHAEVLEPAQLRSSIVEWLEAMARTP